MMCLFSEQRSQTLGSLSTDCIYLNNLGLHVPHLSTDYMYLMYPHNVSLCVDAFIKLYLVKKVALSCFISYDLTQRPVPSRTLTRLVSDLKFILCVQH